MNQWLFRLNLFPIVLHAKNSLNQWLKDSKMQAMVKRQKKKLINSQALLPMPLKKGIKSI